MVKITDSLYKKQLNQKEISGVRGSIIQHLHQEKPLPCLGIRVWIMCDRCIQVIRSPGKAGALNGIQKNGEILEKCSQNYKNVKN